MVDVLLGHVRVVPDHFLLEPTRRGVVLDLGDLGPDDALEPVQDRAGAKPVERVGPLRSVAQTDGVVIAVGVAKAQHEAPRRLDRRACR